MKESGNIKSRLYSLLIGLTIILLIFGLISVYSTSFAISLEETKIYTNQYLRKQTMWIIIGLVVSSIILFSDYIVSNFKKSQRDEILRVIIMGIYITILLLLLAVFFKGVEINGAKRWIRLLGINIQPSEFAKIAMILMASYILNKKEPSFLKWAGATFLIIILVYPSGTTNAIHLSAISFIILISSNINSLYIILSFFGGLVVTTGFILMSENRLARLFTYTTAYQPLQSLEAIRRGGLFGNGYGNGLQKYFYLPEIHTDYIFAGMAEEIGFVGIIIFMIIFILFIITIFSISYYSSTNFARLVSMGIGAMFANQFLEHIRINLVLGPSTGVPLPFISYGGSSMLTSLIAVSILIIIIRRMEE